MRLPALLSLAVLVLVGCSSAQHGTANPAAAPTTVTVTASPTPTSSTPRFANDDDYFRALLVAADYPTPYLQENLDLAEAVCLALDAGVTWSAIINAGPLSLADSQALATAAVLTYCPEHQAVIPE